MFTIKKMTNLHFPVIDFDCDEMINESSSVFLILTQVSTERNNKDKTQVKALLLGKKETRTYSSNKHLNERNQSKESNH